MPEAAQEPDLLSARLAAVRRRIARSARAAGRAIREQRMASGAASGKGLIYGFPEASMYNDLLPQHRDTIQRAT